MDERNQQNPQQLSEEEEFAAYLKQQEEAEGKQGQENQAEEEPEQQEVPQNQAQPPAKQEQEQPKDWTEELPEQFRERVRQEIAAREKAAKQYEAQWKAQTGQLAPIQRKLAEYERREREKSQAQQKQENPGGMTNAEWERYKREMPEDAKAIEAGLNAKLNPLGEQMRSIAERLEAFERRQQLQDALDQVREVHEDYDEIDNDPEFGVWLQAMREQDPFVSKMTENGRRPSPDELIALIGYFKRDRELVTRLQREQQPAAPQIAPDPKAQVAVQKREQQKRDTPVRQHGQSARGRPNAPVDPEEAEFAAYLERNPP